MKKTLIESGRTYGFGDFVRIPLTVCPFYTVIKMINRILAALTPSLQVLATAAFVDTALAIFAGQAGRREINLPLLWLILIVAYNNLNWQLISFIDLKSEMRLTTEYRSAVAHKRAALEYRYIEDNDTWDLIRRTCEDPVGKISGGFDNIMGAAEILIRVGSLLTILMAQVWWAGLAIVAISVPLFALALKGGKAIYEENKEAMKFTRRADYLRSVLQGRESVEERAMFGYSQALNREWNEKYEAARRINLKVTARYFVRIKGSGLITVALSVLIICVLLFPLRSGEVSVGMFMGLVTSTLSLVQMMSWNLSEIMKNIAVNLEYLKDLTRFCALSETKDALALPQWEETAFEEMEFRHVSFKYPCTEQEILKDFNLKIVRGRHYAFVGVNGAGKTTITRLLTGFYDNYEGEILINGRELRSLSLGEIRALFGVVCQDFARYQIPMEENIALGNVLRRDPEEIRQAAEQIGLGEVIEKLPQGMKTPLGKASEKGVDLSGGEWQRVAIARALYNPAAVRILDEPTAALDPVAESNIYEMFGKVSAGKTTIFITHRLGAARLADEIIVLDGGRVAEQGNHQELLSRQGIYANMFEAQRSWYQ